MNTTPKDITVRDLALELGQPMDEILSSASSLFAHPNCPVPVFSDRGQDKSEWILSGTAADRIRRHFPGVVVAPARTGMGSPMSGETWDLPHPESAPSAVAVASLLIRQGMALADEGIGTWDWSTSRDSRAMYWAVATAGYLYDQHVLWDYGMLTDAQHVHKCISHRHTGTGTRQPRADFR